MMKILQIGAGLSVLGGTESVIVNLANEMSKHQDVTVCSLFKPKEGGLFYTRFSSRVKLETLNIIYSGVSICFLLKVFWYLKNVQADIVHIHGFFCYYVLPILFCRDKKFVYTVHSDARKESSKWDRRIHFLKRWCFKNHFLFPITISEESQRSFRDYYKLKSKRINNAIAKPIVTKECPVVENSRITRNTKVFIHPGRISEPKNQVVLCKVFRRLIDEGNDVVLLIAGTIHEDDIFKEIQSFFCERICFLGERDDVPQLLSCADGFCLPSVWEGLPMTLLESLSVGCIPICSPVGGIVNVIQDGDNGILSKTCNEEDYYSAMKRFLNMSTSEIDKMKMKCTESFNPFDIKYAVKEHIEYYQSIIGTYK